MRRPILPWATAVTLVVVLIADRLTKIWVVRSLPFEVPVTVIPGLENWFTFTYIHNTGAAFGMLPQASLFFTVVAIAVALGLVVWYDRLPVRYLPVRIAVGMIMAGALGNLVDRVNTGYVVDFIHFHFFPIWNVADASVSVGTVILGIYLLFVADEGTEAMANTEELQRQHPPNARI